MNRVSIFWPLKSAYFSRQIKNIQILHFQFISNGNILKIYFDDVFTELKYHFVMKEKYDSASVNLFFHNPSKTDTMPDRDRFR